MLENYSGQQSNETVTLCVSVMIGDERPQAFRKCRSQRDMSLERRMQPVNRQAPIQYVPQIPHAHSDIGVVRSDLLHDLCQRVRVTGWALQAKVWERVLQRVKETSKQEENIEKQRTMMHMWASVS
jgi:hypothetical protein